MSPTLWTAAIAIVVFFEFIRIVMSTWVLLHILELPGLGQTGDLQHVHTPVTSSGQAQRSRMTARTRAEMEGLLDPTLLALRSALGAPQQAQALAAADAALERYLTPLARMAEQEGQAGSRSSGNGRS